MGAHEAHTEDRGGDDRSGEPQGASNGGAPDDLEGRPRTWSKGEGMWAWKRIGRGPAKPPPTSTKRASRTEDCARGTPAKLSGTAGAGPMSQAWAAGRGEGAAQQPRPDRCSASGSVELARRDRKIAADHVGELARMA